MGEGLSYLPLITQSCHISNFANRRSLQRLNTLSPVTSEGGQDQVSFLDTPVAVYAGLVVSAGNCSVENLTLNVNISIRDRQIEGESHEIDML